ncbi:MAG: putative adenine modification enzyme [Prokaryotic dsDNA virus sp.]|nr:MAG: putative adenine modification enzyme [Prokaryotic dsDNA virus sp.]|tara:strand:+ start:6932 stop:7963 length:1032 start_codon:yes stop_codon:yes gene_type:complete
MNQIAFDFERPLVENLAAIQRAKEEAEWDAFWGEGALEEEEIEHHDTTPPPPHPIDQWSGASVFEEGEPGRCCSHCGEDLEEMIWSDECPAWYCIGLGSEEFSDFDPNDLHAGLFFCCLDMKDNVNARGYEAAFGFSPEAALSVFLGRKVHKAWASEGDNQVVVCALEPVDPTKPKGQPDEMGRLSASSPKGWQSQVFEVVTEHHRHHQAPTGHKFSVAVYNGKTLVGVAVVGRPVSRVIQAAEPRTLEVTRVCTFGNPALRRNAASKLYAIAGKRAKALGYDRLISYTLAEEENGASLKASGFTAEHKNRGGSWDTPSRRRNDKSPTVAKIRWARNLKRRGK